MRDRHGNEVDIGDVVRVLEIAPEFLSILDVDERVRVEAMLNNEYVVDALPEENKVSISISWDEGDGRVGFSGLHMLSEEFELVRGCPSYGSGSANDA